MAATLCLPPGKYRSVADSADPLSWSRAVDVDIWQETSDDERPGRWLARLNDRKYAEAPISPLALRQAEGGGMGLVVVADFPHWILRGRIAVQGKVIHEESGEVKLEWKQECQGMTGLETWVSELAMATDGADKEEPYVADEIASNPVYDGLVDRILRDFSPPNSRPREPRVEALVVVKDGRNVFERYFCGMTPSTLHIISSCTKSITSLLAGIAIHQGLFGLDDKIVDHFPDVVSDWGDDPPVLVRHVLAMTAGTEHTTQDAQELLESTDVEQLVLGWKRVSAPGTRYNYDNGLPALVGCLIERRSGMPLEVFAERHLLGPLGIVDCVWTRMPKPTRASISESPVLAAGGMFLTLTSLVRIGQMLLQNGVYAGQQIVPAWYVRDATSRQTPAGDYPYGFYFHLNALGEADRGPDEGEHLRGLDGYFALGQGQQVLFVGPRDNLVIAAFSSTWHRDAPDRPAPWAVFDCINDAVSKAAGSG